jgi:hypothetical protein
MQHLIAIAPNVGRVWAANDLSAGSGITHRSCRYRVLARLGDHE